MCSGGHGLSIGSVGGRDDNTVETVKFLNNEVKNSVNGNKEAYAIKKARSHFLLMDLFRLFYST